MSDPIFEPSDAAERAAETLRAARRALNATLVAMAITLVAAGISALLAFGGSIAGQNAAPFGGDSKGSLEQQIARLSAELRDLRNAHPTSETLASLTRDVQELRAQQHALSQVKTARSPTAALAWQLDSLQDLVGAPASGEAQ